MKINQSIKDLKLSATLAINEKSNQLIQEGKRVYKLGLGQSPFPVPQEVVESLQDNAHQKDYLPVKGLYELRKEVSNYYQRNYQLNFSPENILISPGSKELLFLVQLVFDGDLLLPSPSWVSYSPQATIAGKNCHWLPTYFEDQYLLSAKTLEEYCIKNPESSKIIILNYPNNPTGTSYDEVQLKEIARVASKHEIIIISDEIYGEVRFDGEHQSLAKYYPEGTIISSGLSKWCGAGGWRLGTFLFPESLSWLINAMASVASETYTSTSAPIQYAAIAAFKSSPHLKTYLNNSRAVLSKIANYLYSEFNSLHLTIPKPVGGFYILPDFSYYRKPLKAHGINNDEELCRILLEDTGIAILPGSVFGFDSSRLLTRLSYVDFNGEESFKFLSGDEDDNAFVKMAAPNIFEATQKLKQWISNLSS